MYRVLDKYFNTTTYKQEFCIGPQLPREVKKPMDDTECKAKFIPGTAVGLPPSPTALGKCPCQPGGLLPPRGAAAQGLPTNMDKRCPCYFGRKCVAPPIKQKSYVDKPKKKTERQKAAVVQVLYKPKFERKPKMAGENSKSLCPSVKYLRCPQRNQPQGGNRGNDPPWLNERRDPDVLRLTRHQPKGEIREVVQREETRAEAGRCFEQPTAQRGRLTRSRSDVRIPGPFWIRQRPDEVLRKRKFDNFPCAQEVIRGEDPGQFGKPCKDFPHPKRRPGPCASGTHISGPFRQNERPDERKEVDVLRKKKFPVFCEAKEVIHGENLGREEKRASKCRPNTSYRTPGSCCANHRSDERREPEVGRKRRIEQQGELADVVHGEVRERRRENKPPVNPHDIPSASSQGDPFWTLERQDERRDLDMDKKKKFGRQKNPVGEIVHGEDFRAWYDQQEDQRLAHGPEGYDGGDEDDSEPFPFHQKACRCAPPPPQGGPDKWILEKDWGNLKGRGHDKGGNKFDAPPDVEEAIRKPPAARLSCAPETEVANFDQPNAFMRKLYEKYPYLYQVLQETPPEELISRVFKDRFLSTYQVDYLHMGIGKIDGKPPGGKGPRPTGPDGEPEPEEIPGCSYRHSQKGNFGRKKYEQKDKKEKELEQQQEDKEEGGLSEYMATISKLGREIIQDQLYAVAERAKKMKKENKFM